MKNADEVLDANIRGRCPTHTLSRFPFSAEAVPCSLPNAFRLSNDIRNCKGKETISN